MPLVLENLFAYLSDTLFPQRKAMAELRGRWGNPGDKDGWRASDYFDLVRGPVSCIDDKTWADLEYPAFFASMDSTVTPIGSQVLYRRMREYGGDGRALATNYAVCAELRSSVALRESLQCKLLPLRDESNTRIVDFIFGKLPPAPRHQGLLWLWSLSSVAVLVGLIVLAWPVWVWIAMLFVNAFLIFRSCADALRDAETLTHCLQLVKVADDLASLHDTHRSLPQLARLQEQAPNRRAVRKALRWLARLRRPGSAFVSVWLNFAFLVELLAHGHAMRSFAVLRHKLAASFELVGEIDAMIAIASWLAYRPGHCQPILSDCAVLDIEDGCHPLLDAGVGNSIRLDRRSALVTGSNMAGKTTFIKMVGVNVLLGQTLGFCLASSATIPRSSVMASIQAGHSVASGKSHYFSEVETIQSFLARQVCGGCTIFVIDELFSGTNTIERVAVARAVLESLSEHSIVLATTHDVELQALLEDRYELFHFQESPEVDGFFDYRLRAGPATERNAIRLLGELGFPDGIVASAMVYAERELRAGGPDAVRRGQDARAQPVRSA
ncbi:MAG: MutS-related protein [Rhodanobacteraceae bacterium]